MSARPWAARRAALAAACLAVAAASCAPPPHPGARDLAVRYAVARDRREALLRAFGAEAIVRIDGRATGRLPALPATLDLASPDRARLRVSGIVGVLLDVLVARDSVWAWVPSQHLAFAAAGDSLGLVTPALLAGRALGAAWAPPASAWRDAAPDSAATRLAWREGSDSLVLVVDAGARPVRGWIGRGRTGIAVRWSQWSSVGGEAFPMRAEVADDSGWVRVRLDCDEAHVAPRADDGIFAVRRGGNWRTVGLGDLGPVIQRRGLP